MKHSSLLFKNDILTILDQTLLPQKVKYKKISHLKDVYTAIKNLQVRGAPLIGVFAAYGLYVSLNTKTRIKKTEFIRKALHNIDYLKTARPTAVNLSWALTKIQEVILNNKESTVPEIKRLIKKTAERIHRDDVKLCRMIGITGCKLISKNDSILTHCNTGFLATSGNGTALSVIYEAYKKYPKIKVYVDETRPLLQGARLTSWELLSKNIDLRLITDNSAAFLMQKKKITKVIVGADRITSLGFTANKVGTYNLAVLCKHHKIPFYVAAPSSTFDLSISKSKDIPIEERPAKEIKTLANRLIAPKDVKACNPAFDITPPGLITGIITEKGIIYQPSKKNILKILNRI
jgi:methylthioribose-1-phosphate isomerase